MWGWTGGASAGKGGGWKGADTWGGGWGAGGKGGKGAGKGWERPWSGGKGDWGASAAVTGLTSLMGQQMEMKMWEDWEKGEAERKTREKVEKETEEATRTSKMKEYVEKQNSKLDEKISGLTDGISKNQKDVLDRLEKMAAAPTQASPLALEKSVRGAARRNAPENYDIGDDDEEPVGPVCFGRRAPNLSLHARTTPKKRAGPLAGGSSGRKPTAPQKRRKFALVEDDKEEDDMEEEPDEEELSISAGMADTISSSLELSAATTQ